MSVQRIPLSITTDAAGAGTATTPAPVNGWVLEVRMANAGTSLTVGGSADFTVTRLVDGGTIWAESNVSAPFVRSPRPAQHTTAGGTTSYATGIGPVLDPRGVPVDDYAQIVVAQGALSASGTVYLFVEGRGGA